MAPVGGIEPPLSGMLLPILRHRMGLTGVGLVNLGQHLCSEHQFVPTAGVEPALTQFSYIQTHCRTYLPPCTVVRLSWA